MGIQFPPIAFLYLLYLFIYVFFYLFIYLFIFFYIIHIFVQWYKALLNLNLKAIRKKTARSFVWLIFRFFRLLLFSGHVSSFSFKIL